MKTRARLLLSFIVVFVVQPAVGENTDQDLSILTEIQAARQGVIESERKQRELLAAIYQLNQQIRRVVEEKGSFERDRFAVEVELADLDERIKALELDLRNKRGQLRSRIRAINRMGGHNILRGLFSVSNAGELDRLIRILSRVAERDTTEIRSYLNQVDELQLRHEQVLWQKERLENILAEVEIREEQIQGEQRLKGRLLSAARRSRDFQALRLSQLRRKSDRMALSEAEQRSLDTLLRPSFFEARGELPPPVAGTPLRRFGVERDPKHNVTLAHRGFLYIFRQGSSVRSVFPGRVAFRGEIPGLGPTLILDHGDHYYTVYAGNLDLQVEEAEEVEALFEIAHLKGETESGRLYFEVRHFSEPNDPADWLARSYEQPPMTSMIE